VRSDVLDDTRVIPVVPPSAVRRPVRPVGGPDGGRPRRLPVTVAAAATLAVLQSLGLLTLGLTSLETVLGVGRRPDGVLVAGTLLLLAGWVVLGAAGGAALVDGAGRQLMLSVACGEIVLLVVLALAGVAGADGVRSVVLGPLGALPVPALALLALGLPSAKLLLATSPSAVAWVRAGGRPRAARPAPAVEHRALRGATVVCIGLALTGVAVVGGPSARPGTPSPVAVVDAP
jgi:hypothetical protein